MSRGKKYKPEEIIPTLREAEVLMPQGMNQDLAAKQIGVSTPTMIRRRKEYGGLRMDQAKRLKELITRMEAVRNSPWVMRAANYPAAGELAQYALLTIQAKNYSEAESVVRECLANASVAYLRLVDVEKTQH